MCTCSCVVGRVVSSYQIRKLVPIHFRMVVSNLREVRLFAPPKGFRFAGAREGAQ